MSKIFTSIATFVLVVAVSHATDEDAGWVGDIAPAVGPKLGKIIGGVEARPHSLPFMVAMTKTFGSYSKLICGGSLISPRHVLTARHCFEPEFLGDRKNNATQTRSSGTFFSALVGIVGRILSGAYGDPGKSFAVIKGAQIRFWFGAHENPAHAGPETTTLQTARAVKVFFLENREDPTYEPDMIVVRLDRDIETNEGVSTICLANDGLPPPESPAQIAGWGQHRRGRWADPESDFLRAGNIIMKALGPCREAYANRRALFQPFEFCAGHPEASVDSCSGDSGGPIFRSTSGNSQFVIFGLVARGRGCALLGYPGIYTAIYPFLDQIRAALESDGVKHCEASVKSDPAASEIM